MYTNTHNGRFLLASNFREVKNKIGTNPSAPILTYFSAEQSSLFPIFKKMPKGGILHVHGIGDLQFLINNAIYDPNCWLQLGGQGWKRGR